MHRLKSRFGSLSTRARVLSMGALGIVLAAGIAYALTGLTTTTPPSVLQVNRSSSFEASATLPTNTNFESARFAFPKNSNTSGANITVTVAGSAAAGTVSTATPGVVTWTRSGNNKTGSASSVRVVVSGVVQASEPGSYSYSVEMTDAAPSRLTAAPSYTLTANTSAPSVGVVSLGTALVSTQTTVTVPVTVGQYGRLESSATAGANKIYVTFPAGATVPSGAASNVTVNGSAATTVTVSGQTATVWVPSGVSVPANGTASVVFKQGFGLVTPSTAGTYTVSASTSAETGSGTSAGFAVRRLLTPSAVASDKTYDGSTAASVTVAGDTLGGDAVTYAYTAATFSSAAAGAGKLVTVSGITISGADANKYQLASTSATTTADISTRALTASFTASGKTYDATIDAALASHALSGIVGSDDVTLTGGSASFSDKTAAAGKTVTYSGYALSGTAAGNYHLANVTATAYADIAQRQLTGHFTAANKTYDATVTADVTSHWLTNIAGSDDVTLSVGSATFASKSAVSGKTVTAHGTSISGADADNYTLSMSTAVADIARKSLSVTAHGVGKTYDGTTAASVTLTTDALAGDTVDATGTASFATKTAEDGKTVSVSGIAISGTDAGNYTLGNTTAETTADIARKGLSVTAHGVGKTYDGTTAASVTLTTDALAGDTVDATGTASFATKTAEDGKTVSVSGIAISGTDAGNYTLGNTTAETTANIAPKAITGAFTAEGKVYDRTTDATVTSRSLVGTISGDDVSLFGGIGAFLSTSAGTDKVVRLTGATLAGTDSGNYALTSVADAAATIDQREIGISAPAWVEKTYDGTATVGVALTTDALPGDSVEATGWAWFGIWTDPEETVAAPDKNAAPRKPLLVTQLAISGADAGNYVLKQGKCGTAGAILPKPTTGSFTAADKVYDNTRTADVVTRAVDGAVPGDDVTLEGGAALFDSPDVANEIAVRLDGASLAGVDAANYTLTSIGTASADITPRPVAGSFTAAGKIYDGSTEASVTGRSVTGVLAGEVLLTGGTAHFSDKNVGTGKTVTLTGASLTGAQSGNYSLSGVATASADISAKEVTGHFTANGKTYDGNASATVATRSLTGTITGDTVALTGGTAAFGSVGVGTGKTVTLTGATLSGADAANYNLTSVADASADITAKSITGSFTASGKTYDGSTDASVTGRSLTGAIGSDSVSLTGGTASFSDKNVGTGKTVTLTGAALDGTDAGNYALGGVSAAAADITAKSITGAFTASDKTYDATITASVATRSLVGTIAGDTVSLTGGVAHFADKNVADGKTVTLTGATLSGADAGNYNLTSVAATTANITRFTLTITMTASSREYDGQRSTAATFGFNKFGTDDVSVTGSGLFEDKNVGTNKLVLLETYEIGGHDGGNYWYPATNPTSTANITPKALAGSFTAADKTYDATVTASVTGRDLTGIIGSDVVTLTGGTARFSDKNVATGKTVTLSGAALGGTDGGNYTVMVATTTASILRKDIAGAFTAAGKVYDGSTAATVTARSLVGTLTGDLVTLSGGTAAFDTKDAAAGKTVTLSGATLSGTDAGNYSLTSIATTTATISAKSITGSFTASGKTYDGTTAATVATRSLSGTVTGDTVSLTGGTASFADKNVGTGKTVTLTGATLSGADVGNYTLTSVGTTTANIAALSITGAFTASDKTYDATVTATVAGRSLVGTASGDTVSLTGGTARFADKNVGTGKTVTLTGATLSGTDAGNYTLSSIATAAANITARSLTITATASGKTYDGSVDASVTLANNKLAGDSITVTGTATFSDKNVGVNKLVTVSNFVLGGTDGGNYTPASATSTTTAAITARSLTITAAGIDKVYDGTAVAHVQYGSNKVAGDSFSTTGTAVYTGNATQSKAVGTGKAISVTAIAISGGDSGNYSPTNTTASTTASITARPLTVSATAPGKTYDGTTASTWVSSSDKVSGDTLTISGTATFADKAAALGKLVTVTGIGITSGDASNYVLVSTTATTTATISPKSITGSFTAASKTYDATVTATILTRSLTGTITGDTVTLTGSAAFDTKTAASGKTVRLYDAALAGADAGNYSLASVGTTTATINRLAIGGHFTSADKTYDATTAAAAADRALTGVLGTDEATLEGGAAHFSDKNVGANKVVTLAGASIAGTDAANYSLSAAPTTTASITAATVAASIAAADREYDGTTDASVTRRSLSGTLTGDVVALSGGSASFDTKDVGENKVVTLTGAALSGADAGNYELSSVGTTTATILAKGVPGSFRAADKTYDGTVTATVVSRSVAGIVVGETVSLTGGEASFSDKTVGENKTVTLTGAELAGTDASNYVLTGVGSTTATITAQSISGSFTASDKTYDATVTATVTGRDLAGVVEGDDVILTGGTPTFADKSVGKGKSVALAGAALSGSDSANYLLTGVADASAEIVQRAIVVEASGIDKTYDGTTTAQVLLSTDALAGDLVVATGTAQFASRDVAVDIAVTVSGLSISGDDASNYNLGQLTASTSAAIHAKALTGTFTAADKTYDATNTATVTGRDLVGVVAGDDVTLSGGSATFSDKNVGEGKSVTLAGATLAGTEAHNYDLTGVDAAAATIGAKHLGGTFTAADKTYDGTSTATVTARNLPYAFAGDDVALSGGSAAFSDENAGADKVVVLVGATLDGVDAGNYVLDGVADASATIDLKSVTGTFTAADKTYDGTVTADVTGRDLVGVVAGDDVTLSGGSATFSDKNVGEGKAVALTGATLGGADASNYDLAGVDDVAARIRKHDLSITAHDIEKAFATLYTFGSDDYTAEGLVGGDTIDSVDLASEGAAEAAAIATYTITASSATGEFLGNYDITYHAGVMTVLDLTAPHLVATANPSDWTTGTVTIEVTATDDSNEATLTITSPARDAVIGATPVSDSVTITDEGRTTVTYEGSDAAGNVATGSIDALIDRTAPTMPGTPNFAALTATSVRLSWAAAQDDLSGVSAYDVYRDGVLCGSSSTTSFNVTGLTAGTQYSFTVVARDAVDNASDESASFSITLPTVESSASITGGENVSQQIALPSSGGATRTATVNFASASSGTLTVVKLDAVPSSIATDLVLEDALFFDISFTGTYTAPVRVTLPYDPWLSPGRAARLTLLHFVDGAWESISPVSGGVDTTNHTVTFELSSLSPMALVESQDVNKGTVLSSLESTYAPAYGKATTLTATLADSWGNGLTGRVVKYQISKSLTSGWSKLTTMAAVPTTPGAYAVSVKPLLSTGKTYVRFVFAGDARNSAAPTSTAVILPMAYLVTPSYSRISTRYYYISGYIKPVHAAYYYLEYEFYDTTLATYVAQPKSARYKMSSTGKFKIKKKFSKNGKWRVRVTHSDSGHSFSASPWRTITSVH